MKKLLSLGLLLCAMSCIDAATTTYDITTANKDKTGAGSMTTNTGNVFIKGFKFSLDSDWFFPTVAGGGSAKADIPSQISLDSLSITGRDSTATNIFILSGDATQAGQSQLVGFCSSTSASTANGIHTWSFDGVILDSSTTYTFVFSSQNSADAWTSTSTVGSMSTNQGIKVGTMGTHMPSSYPNGEGMYNNYGNFITNFGSTIKLSVSALPVPEPSSCALALIGVSALLLRRRVK